MDLERKMWSWWLDIRTWRLYLIVISLQEEELCQIERRTKREGASLETSEDSVSRSTQLFHYVGAGEMPTEFGKAENPVA